MLNQRLIFKSRGSVKFFGIDPQELFLNIKARASSHWNGFELAGHVPDQRSGVKRYIWIIAYFIKDRNGGGSLHCLI